ncbi:MAG TPA: hypothetical protein VD906_08010 [Caulobacteraceae bacterium]|nr:hypothetical protein [Caulobacteraceae bacterium]
MNRSLLLFWTASAAIFGFIFGNEADEIFLTDLAILLAALVVILAGQTALILAAVFVFRRLGREKLGEFIARLMMVGLLMANAYYTTFMNFDSSAAVQVVLAVVVGALFIPPIVLGRWRGFALFMTCAYFVMSLGLYGYTRATMQAPQPAAGTDVRIASDRNVYLIGHESLNSPKAFRELHGLTDLPHVDYLEANGFRVLDSAYSAAPTTVQNFSRIFEFGRELTNDEGNRRVAFTSRNSAFTLFQESGYKIQFMYASTHFGVNPMIVDYTFPESGFYQCQFVPHEFFYILCREPVRDAINRYIFGVTPMGLDVIERRARAAARSKEPWFTFYHHSFPFHTAMTHSYKDAEATKAFQERLKEALPKVRRDNFEGTIGTILREDPNAVILAVGDHGASITRGADLDTPNPVYTNRQLLEDRFGVLLAVYPKDFCQNRIFEGSTTTYLLENVAKCLDGDDAPTAEEIKRSKTFHWKRRRNLDDYAGG